MAWASTMPSVVGVLSATLTAALTPTPVLVWQHTEAAALTEAVTVAHQGEQDASVADGGFTSEGFVSNPDREAYSIRCVSAVRDGTGDAAAASTRAFTLLGAVGAALAADRHLGGLVLTARVGDWTLTVTPDTRGVIAELFFNIEIDAYTTI